MLTHIKPRAPTHPSTPEGYMAPWTEMAHFHFDPMVGYFPMPRLFEQMQTLEPQVDIHESEEVFFALISLPGFVPEQVEIEATRNTFTLYGERPALISGEFQSTPLDTGLSRATKVQVTYRLPEEIAPEQIQVCFEAGVLYLRMPKREQTRFRSVKVQIPVPE